MQVPNFLVEFVTPIVKVSKGAREQSFFTLPQYTSWVESNGGTRGWTVKYYKGVYARMCAD